MLTLATLDTIGAKVDAGGTDVVYDLSGMIVDNTSGLVEGTPTGNHGDVPTTAAALHAAAGSGNTLVVSRIWLHNTGASTRTITLYLDRNDAAPDFDADTQIATITLASGQTAIMDANGRWTTYDTNGHAVVTDAIDVAVRVASDVVNATTSFADITGLIVPIRANRVYLIELYLYYITNATTTGARFGFNGPASPSAVVFGQDSASSPALASTNIAAGVAIAYDTAIVSSTTGPGAVRAIAQIQGTVENGANAGNFAARFASEVAVANGLTVQRGSWMKVREVA